MKKFLSTALVAAVAGTAVAPAMAAPLSVAPAAFAEGVITALDNNARTITLGQQTYTLGATVTLPDVQHGSEVDVAYVVENGKRIAIAVTRVDNDVHENVAE